MNNIYISALAGNLYVNEYTENVLNRLDADANIYFLSPPSDNDIYNKKNISFLLSENTKKKGILSIVNGWRVSLSKMCRNNPPSVFLVHNANPWTILKYYLLWKKAKKRILIFWGTDVNEMSKKNALILRIFLPSVTDMGFTSETLRNVFLNRFGLKYTNKTHITVFGMPLFRDLKEIHDKCKTEKEDLKIAYRREFDLPDDRIIVHIGYNAPKAQQHLKILESLKRLPSEEKEKLYVLVPFGYGKYTDKYKNAVEEAIHQSGINGSMMQKYLDKQTSAKLRNACDIFIYGRTMDSHSFTPAEYMYAGARVIMPKWLMQNYKELDSVKDYEYYVYNDFDELTVVVREIIQKEILSGENEPRGADKLRECIGNEFSWEVRVLDWDSLLA